MGIQCFHNFVIFAIFILGIFFKIIKGKCDTWTPLPGPHQEDESLKMASSLEKLKLVFQLFSLLCSNIF